MASTLNVDNIANAAGTGAPSLTQGATVAKYFALTTTNDSSSTGTINALTTTSSIHRFSASTTITLNGITALTDGTVLIIQNDTGNTLTVNNLSGSASAANQIKIPGGAAVTLAQGENIMLYYINTLWRANRA